MKGGESDHLLRLTCSVALWRGRGTANKHHWQEWGVLEVDGSHRACTCTSQVHTAQASECAGNTQTICLTHLPGPGRFVPQVHHEGTGTRRAMCLRRVAELRLWLSWLMQTIREHRKTWIAHSLAGDMVSGAEIATAPCLPPPAVAHLSLCLQGGAINPIWLALLWYLLRWVPLFCEHVRGHCTVLEPSCGEGPLFFFVSLLFLQIGLLCHISSLRLSSGHSNMVLTLRTCHVAHLLWADASVWFASLLVIAVQHRFCGLFFCLFVFQVCCSLSFQSSLLIQIVRFPMVWKFLLLHGSLPRTGLHPWIFCLSFCLLSFVLPPFKEIGLAFWVIWCPLPAFRSCSVEVAPHSDYLLMCLWGRKWSPHPTPLPSWDLAHAIILTWKIPWTQNPGGL